MSRMASHKKCKFQCTLELNLFSLSVRSTSGCLEKGPGRVPPSFFPPLPTSRLLPECQKGSESFPWLVPVLDGSTLSETGRCFKVTFIPGLFVGSLEPPGPSLQLRLQPQGLVLTLPLPQPLPHWLPKVYLTSPTLSVVLPVPSEGDQDLFYTDHWLTLLPWLPKAPRSTGLCPAGGGEHGCWPAQPSTAQQQFPFFLSLSCCPRWAVTTFHLFFFFEKSFQNCLDYVLFITVQIHEVLME